MIYRAMTLTSVMSTLLACSGDPNDTAGGHTDTGGQTATGGSTSNGGAGGAFPSGGGTAGEAAGGSAGAGGSTGGSTGSNGSSLLRVGMSGTFSDEILGKGPGQKNGTWSDTGPIYGSILGRSAPNELPDHIAIAEEKDLLLVLNMAGSRNQWTNLQGDCKMYDKAKYRARIDEYMGVPGLEAALAERRVVIYVVDEPNIDDFCNSITPTEANEMGLYTKQKFPGAITIIRSGADVLSKGFGGEGPTDASTWTGIDYAYGLYKGWMKSKDGKTATEWFPEEKARLAKLDLGMVMGLNTLNHGSDECWDYLANGSSSGRIRGQNQGANGGVPCSQDPNGEINWLASPDFLREAIDAAVQDPDAPFINMWTHIYPTSPDQEFLQYEVRSDYVDAYEYMIQKGESRKSWNGWRPAK